MKISNKLYDILKWLVIIVLPALATLYAALAAVWVWPDPDQVVTTITAVDTFLGAVLCISSATYNKEGKSNG
nr:MAG TPA: holin [Caudoviricetes sp.]